MKASFQAHQSAASSISASFVLPAGCPLPLFRIGQRVLWQENYNNVFTHRVIGTVCGFEYLDHPDFDSGWSYHLNVEESTIVRADGSILRFTESILETGAEAQITHFNQECLTLLKLAG